MIKEEVEAYLETIDCKAVLEVFDVEELEQTFTIAQIKNEEDFKDTVVCTICVNYSEIAELSLTQGIDWSVVLEELFNLSVQINPSILNFSPNTKRARGGKRKATSQSFKKEKTLPEKKKIDAIHKINFDYVANKLKEEVIGHNSVVDELMTSLKCASVGIAEPERPLGMYMFGGTSGCGKTLLTKEFTKAVWGKEWKNHFIKLNGSEFSSRHEVSKLIGAPPGYIGHDEKNSFADTISEVGECVVLFDEIEKAHFDILNIFLQIADDGCFFDKTGEKIDCRKVIFFFTTNIGNRNPNKVKVGFIEQENSVGEDMEESIKRTLSPEFFNRIDKLFVFDILSELDFKLIINLYLKQLNTRLSNSGIKIKISKKAKEFIVKDSYSREYGARELKRRFGKIIENRVAEEIVAHGNDSRTFKFDIKNDKVRLSVDDKKENSEDKKRVSSKD